MTAQDVTLGVAVLGFLGTLSVQFINYLTTVRTKKLDAQQRQYDRAQELRKIYVAKKLKAGEAFASKLVATIDKFDMTRLMLAVADEDGDLQESHLEHLLHIGSQVEEFANSAILKSGPSYLYFEAHLLEQQTGSVWPAIVRKEGELLTLKSEKKRLEKLLEIEPPSRAKDNISSSYHENRRKYQQGLKDYGALLLQHRAYLVKTCEALRESLARYDLPE